MGGLKRSRSFHKTAAAGALLLAIQAIPSMSQQVLTIGKAVEIAMSTSPTMQHSKLNLERSRETLNAQQAALKSRFSLSLNPFSYNRDRTFSDMFSVWNTSWTKSSQGTFTISQPLKWTDGTFQIINQLNWQNSFSEYSDDNTRSFSNSLYLNLQQPIFTYNRTKLSLRELELDLENTSLEYSLQKLSLERQVTQYFYSVYQSRATLDISRDEMKNQELSYEIIKNKVDAGLSAREELYQAELNLASSKADMQNNEVELENALDTFKQLIGLPITDTVTIDADITYKPVEVSMERALDHALKFRMELRQRNIDIETARNDVLVASAQNEFKGSVNLSYGLVGTDQTLGDIYQSPTRKQVVGISFDIPLWDWGEKKSRVNASKLSMKSSELSLEEEKTDMIIAIRKAYRNLNNLVNQIEIAEQSVRNAQLTYDINLERYRNGDLTSMDLNLYQNQLSQKKTSLTDAQINYKLGILSMKILTLWDFENNQPVMMENLEPIRK